MRTRAGTFWTLPDGYSPNLSDMLKVWESAACADTDPEVFFPLRTASPEPALTICRRCPVRNLCLDTFGPLVPHGVVGGLTEDQRRDQARKGAA